VKYHEEIVTLAKHISFLFLECQLYQIIIILHYPFCKFLLYSAKNLVPRPARMVVRSLTSHFFFFLRKYHVLQIANVYSRQSFVTITWKKSKYLQWCSDSIERWAALNRDIVYSVDISLMRNSHKPNIFLKFDALALMIWNGSLIYTLVKVYYMFSWRY